LYLDHVLEFNSTYDVVALPEERGTLRMPQAKLRFDLIKEEFEELIEAYDGADIVEVVDALADIEYVTKGAAVVFGIVGKVRYQLEIMEEPDAPYLFNEDAQEEILKMLSHAIIFNDIDKGAEVLAAILKLLDYTSNLIKVDLDSATAAVHKSNMTKLGEDGKPVRNENNKVIKGPNYQTPTKDIENILFGEQNAQDE
jgi:predicted HAD superfamily Cof-like phosphohydrolase